MWIRQSDRKPNPLYALAHIKRLSQEEELQRKEVTAIHKYRQTITPMASSFGGFSSISTCMASTTRKPTPLLVKTSLVSFCPPVTSAICNKQTPLSRKWSLFAVPEALEAKEQSQPEPVESQIASAVANDPSKGEEVFAVVMIGSRQYIVFPGRFIYTQRLKGANVNDKIVLSKVLLVGTKKNAYIGEPVVPNAVVHAVVEEQGLNPKVIVFKYKKKKNYRRTIGHRQPNTRLRITGIAGYENAPADPMPTS